MRASPLEKVGESEKRKNCLKWGDVLKMCGIMGYTGPRRVVDVVVGGLECLEYRGYDSAGIAVAGPKGLGMVKCVGSVANLKAKLETTPLEGSVGIGHTRWATHGGVTDENAHPHADPDRKVVLIHNGIVENFHELRQELSAQGVAFLSETDTEVAVCLIARLYALNGGNPQEALRGACRRFRGSFAFVVLFTDLPDRFYCVRKGPPLILGAAEGEAFCASDATALLPYTHDILFMEDDQIAELSAKGIALSDFEGRPLPAELSTVDWDPEMASKGMYPHFMLKEIEEQGGVLRRTLAGRLTEGSIDLSAELPLTDEEAASLRRVQLIACGTSFYAALATAGLFDRFTGLDLRVETASEYRYGDAVCDPSTLSVFVSQSGETADTLAAARGARARGARCLAVTNVAGSSLAREVGAFLELRAGPEIGVAATKTFMGQLAALTLLALWIGKRRGRLSPQDESRLAGELKLLPLKVEELIVRSRSLKDVAERRLEARGFLFIGRGASYPVALEGALKLKEISYVHAEAHSAGEMKHGPIAMLDETMPVVALLPRDRIFEKTLSNVQEARARRSPIIAVATEGDPDVPRFADDCIFVPGTEDELTPFLTVIPLQYFAYYLAYLMGREIDRPRNLAKSVTVE